MDNFNDFLGFIFWGCLAVILTVITGGMIMGGLALILGILFGFGSLLLPIAAVIAVIVVIGIVIKSMSS